MQLTRLVSRSGRAVWLLVLVPLLAVAGSVAVLSGAEPATRTLATVSVIAPEGGTTAATVTQAVDGFRSTLASDTVLGLAARDTGSSLDPGDVVAERVGTSNLVELRLRTDVGEDGEDGEELVRALVDHANDALYSSAITSTSARVDAAEARYRAALDERAEESARTGLLLPIEAYRAKTSEVTQLRVALATGAAGADRAAVQETLDDAVRDLRRIGESVSAFEGLEDRVARSRAEVGAAELEADAVRARLDAARAPASITVGATTEQSARTTLVRGVVAALVVGSALALGLVLLIGLLRTPAGPARPAPGRVGATRLSGRHDGTPPDDEGVGGADRTRDRAGALT